MTMQDTPTIGEAFNRFLDNMSIRNVQTFTGFIEAMSRIGIPFSMEDGYRAQAEGLIPVFPKFFEIGGDILVLSIDISYSDISKNSLAYSTIDVKNGRGTYKVVLGKQLIDMAKKRRSILPISFALKHEVKHLLDLELPHGNTDLWNVAADIVINEQLLKEFDVPELKRIIATVENIRKEELETCRKCNIADCQKYLITHDDLKSSMPTFKIYYKLYDLMQECPPMTKVIEKYSHQFHSESQCNCSSSASQAQKNNSENQNNNTSSQGQSEQKENSKNQRNNASSSSKKENNNSSSQEQNQNNDTSNQEQSDFFEKHKNDPVREAGTDRFTQSLYDPQKDEIQLPWDELLQNTLIGAIKNAQTIYPDWSKPNKRFVQYYKQNGIFIPSLKETKPPKGFVVVDISGSIPDELYSKFVAVIVNLMEKAKPEKVDVLFFSDNLIDVKTITPDNIPPLPRLGAGGTLICSTMKHVYEQMEDDDFVVVLSDFYIFDNDQCTDTIVNIGARASVAIQLVPPYGNLENKWNKWKQIIVNEFLSPSSG